MHQADLWPGYSGAAAAVRHCVETVCLSSRKGLFVCFLSKSARECVTNNPLFPNSSALLGVGAGCRD
ncbi:hypothetical protein AV530_009363 [Patagioenas fasciata monilis]|uniref:Uncharacterized protein n=1 Tax=Patagioenas fasciata monilis TaxID=372326 RepID=A0A1V4JIP0_PATFA|nr:hypothetical protein AV530_009363 [Patagioenas fasciata monilis]